MIVIRLDYSKAMQVYFVFLENSRVTVKSNNFSLVDLNNIITIIVIQSSFFFKKYRWLRYFNRGRANR